MVKILLITGESCAEKITLKPFIIDFLHPTHPHLALLFLPLPPYILILKERRRKKWEFLFVHSETQREKRKNRKKMCNHKLIKTQLSALHITNRGVVDRGEFCAILPAPLLCNEKNISDRSAFQTYGSPSLCEITGVEGG